MKPPTSELYSPPPDLDSVSVRPFLFDLWRQRSLILVSLAGVTGLYLCWGLFGYLNAPANVTAQVEFRLVFDGADRGQYPNGDSFTSSDLLSTPVLLDVYQINELDRYLPFERFRDSLFVLESNVALELLSLEYQARLADARLPVVERSRLEAEFRQKRDAQSVPQMYLRLELSSKQPSIPTTVLEKVLNDVLTEWADQVVTTKGGLLYQLDLLTPQVIALDRLNPQTALIRYDLLRRHVGRALAQLGEVSKLPAANVIRVGSDKLSLADLRTNLADLLELHLNPLIRRRLINALSPAESQLNALYLEDRLQELQGVRETAQTRRAQLQAALEAFSAEAPARKIAAAETGPAMVLPQLSDSFLERLIDLGGQSGAAEYRQGLTDRIIEAGEQGLRVDQDMAFYRESLRLLRDAMRGVRGSSSQPGDVSDAFEAIQARVIDALRMTGDAYEQISKANLNARGTLYSIVGPFSVHTESSRSFQDVALRGAAVFLGTLVLLSAVILARGAWRRQVA